MTGRILIGSTLLFVLVLILGGIYYPGSLAMNFADTSLVYTYLRVVIAILLVVLLVFPPPRSHAIRTVIGAWSIILGVLSFQLLFSYQMYLLDAIVFIEVAIIFAVEALETRRTIPVSKKHSPAKKIPVLSI